MTIADTTNSQGKCHAFQRDDGQDEEAVQDDVSMAIKYITNDHQDEDAPIQR